MIDKNHALQLLRQMLGSQAQFRQGQWEAIEAVALKKQRVLVVQRTGWGKSMVYFLATKLLREQGSGPTLLISPLLSLMRNQIESARSLGLHASSINSENKTEWSAIWRDLSSNQVDLLLVSPERLNDPTFLRRIFAALRTQIGLFVVDEAHCISDWGHDFRPDYRRIFLIIQQLPAGTPLLATTATANQRVIDDIQAQLGQSLVTIRGPLARESLRLQAIRLAKPSERLAWLAENLARFKGSGIIYCQTHADTELVTGWLQKRGFNAQAYHAGKCGEGQRAALERDFLDNKVKILVATVALGMGFDKPDISFVIHFQAPGSVIAYYQQAGRAGRALHHSYGILLSGEEDAEIHNFFIQSAFPDARVFYEILHTLEKTEGLCLDQILEQVNVNPILAERALRLLEVDGALTSIGKIYIRTDRDWTYDEARVERISAQRERELEEMQAYIDHKGCSMQFLLKALDDPAAQPCGRCANCRGQRLPDTVSASTLAEADAFFKSLRYEIRPHLEFPPSLPGLLSGKIPANLQNSPGWALCQYGDAGWGKQVSIGKYTDGYFSKDLVRAAVELIRDKWQPDPPPKWICAIPSLRHPMLVAGLAKEISRELKIPFRPILKRTRHVQEQKLMQNEAKQAQNVIDSLELVGKIPRGPVLLIDDIIDSGWTLSMAGYLLRQKGSGPVYPFALAQASTRKTK
ncbi:MAG: RecQ family ATP-dependent DNA helicase [Anaerolineaceae bacterium]|jgi:ATP-dependent DNA helicase RecQ|nr:RecQ family ATP-dependent DNA helicase [Anaerolineaceae bacterium]MDD4042455.1 RecQ family ATP-dependent DNA helicase [Anaerolineaceae bacterium]MDD4577162.1 RecQ family ATP-dependent DNA helicase [Anaerolineaceae bacterium]